MTDETKAVDDFLGDLKNDSEKDLLNESQESPFKTDKKDEEVKEEEVLEEKPERKVPFHKDPKLQRFIEKEVSKRISEIEPKSEPSATDEFKDLVDSFTAIIGNDTPEKVNALSALKNSLSNLDERAAQRALQEIRADAEAEKQAEQEADETLESGFESIEEEYGVDLFSSNNKKLRGQFIDFIEKVAPKDENGEIADFPDIPQAFSIFQATRTRTNPDRSKDLASRSMEKGSGEAPQGPQQRTNWDWARKQIEKFQG